MNRWQAISWVALLAAVLGIAELLERTGFPAPQMIVAIVVGAGLAVIGRLPTPMPREVNTGVQAMLGVLMGSYLQIELLSSIGWDLVPVLAITAATVAVSIGIAVVFARLAKVELPTATLGLLAGGSAAVVAVADELDADPRRVAFMQYLRVAMVALTAPALAVLLDDGDRTDFGAATLGGGVTNPDLPHWMIVGRGDQVAGLSIAVMLCLIGIRLGRYLRLPNPALIGPMIITAVLTAFGVSHGYAPTNLLKELLFVLIGFEVGTRFTRGVVREMARMIPGMIAAIVALSALVGGLAFGLAYLVDLELSDLYLATTPGGINAVLAAAENMEANMPLITSVQSVRLLLMVLMLPLVMRGLRRFTPPAPVPTAASPDPDSEQLAEPVAAARAAA
ncbi:AbrB family transcriptional regulator [Nocardia huaxiensis]|uniref:AbrB family transcriptional regulator n=1 Tax=Nocardia huaxiensis TaxID=2755382 RepID=UPI001E62277F|nr:AbrB family transcriptional regulator [Nocardia huaxiensis]UFS93601.1 AbrB family transcriptional regulator [Nocardia huaxiensis]